MTLKFIGAWKLSGIIGVFAFATLPGLGATYEVGPAKPYATIGSVPWATLAPGDTVLIHAKSTPYREKWVICRQGTAAQPITVRGIADGSGNLPVIDGNSAVEAPGLNYWNGQRSVIKIGGARVPADTMPKYIVLDNLEIVNASQPFTYTDTSGATNSYNKHAASIFVEKGENITIRNCRIHGSGNGLFVASSDSEPSRSVLVEGNYIYDNGSPGSIFEHNTYTAAVGIIFQNNWFGPLKAGALGNSLKDRSSGLVVRYNWIDAANRQLDMVDAEDSVVIRNDPSYRETFVYGNVLLEPANVGNSQILHYGGDSGAEETYRKGTLHFYNNTVVSGRPGNTTLARLSTNDERMDARNNIIYTNGGGRLSLLDESGRLSLSQNWLKAGWVNSFSGSANVMQIGTNISGTSPGFINEAAQDFRLSIGSPAVNIGGALSGAVLVSHDLRSQYVKHQRVEDRPRLDLLDAGAFELIGSQVPTVAILSIVAPSSIQSGQTAILAVNLTAPAGAGGVSVSLASSYPAGMNVPSSITVPQGSSQTTLAVTAGSVLVSTAYTLTASFLGVNKFGSGTIVPVDITTQSQVSFLRNDSTSQGNWKGMYGSDGYSLVGDATQNPGYVTPVSNGPQFTWSPSTVDLRALQKVSGTDRIAATWYGQPSFTIDLNFRDQNTHQVAVYCMDWDSYGPRSQTVEILDENDRVLDTRSVNSFVGGQYLVWNLKGHVKIRATALRGNSVIEGIFFGGGAPTAAATASFVALDSTTQGNWKQKYGADGYSIAADATRNPAYVTPASSGFQYTWRASTPDIRALQREGGTDRIAATWYGLPSFIIDLPFVDQTPHQVAIYCMDWDSYGPRSQTIEVLDGNGNVLDTRTLSAFRGGQYLVWNLSGRVKIRATALSTNSVIEGIFFGAGAPTP